MRIPLIAIALSLTCALVARGATPEEVVGQFCERDARGARLSSERWKEITPLVQWEDEPGWDTVTVSGGFAIAPAEVSHDRATVRVTFDNAGTSDDAFHAAPAREVVLFELARVGKEWKITGPLLRPHVGKEDLITHLKTLAKEDPGSRSRIATMIAGIEKAEVPLTLSCTAASDLEGGGFEEHELTVEVDRGLVTHVSYSNTMSNGEEGGAYFCELELAGASPELHWLRGTKTRVIEKDPERESYVDLVPVTGGYAVHFENVSVMKHCGFGAEFPRTVTVRRGNRQCAVVR